MTFGSAAAVSRPGRINSALVRSRPPAHETDGAYVLDFQGAGPNLVSATELLGRFRTRGLLDQ